MPPSTKIFGREPVLWVTAIQATIVLLAATLTDWTTEQVGSLTLVVFVLGDVTVAYLTKATMLGVLIGLLKAIVSAFAAFGYDLDPDTLAALVAFVTGVLGLFQRTQTSPEPEPSFDLAA